MAARLSMISWTTSPCTPPAPYWIGIGSVCTLPAAVHSSNAAWAASGSYVQYSHRSALYPGMPSGVMPVGHGADAVEDGVVDRVAVDRLGDRLTQLQVVRAADPRVAVVDLEVVRAHDRGVVVVPQLATASAVRPDGMRAVSPSPASSPL